jgi:hypothetical protein
LATITEWPSAATSRETHGLCVPVSITTVAPGYTGQERSHHFARVRDRFLGDDLAGCIEDAHVVPAIPEVQANGHLFNSRYFGFHKAGDDTPAFSSLLVELSGLGLLSFEMQRNNL